LDSEPERCGRERLRPTEGMIFYPQGEWPKIKGEKRRACKAC